MTVPLAFLVHFVGLMTTEHQSKHVAIVYKQEFRFYNKYSCVGCLHNYRFILRGLCKRKCAPVSKVVSLA